MNLLRRRFIKTQILQKTRHIEEIYANCGFIGICYMFRYNDLLPPHNITTKGRKSNNDAGGHWSDSRKCQINSSAKIGVKAKYGFCRSAKSFEAVSPANETHDVNNKNKNTRKICRLNITLLPW